MPTVLPLAEESCAELVQEEATDFRVHSCVYTDPLIYEQEIREVYERSWVYIGHASEIAHPGDYRTGRLGSQPIIIGGHARLSASPEAHRSRLAPVPILRWRRRSRTIWAGYGAGTGSKGLKETEDV
jgi:hypothetical protein